MYNCSSKLYLLSTAIHIYLLPKCALPMKTRKRVNIAVNRAPIDLSNGEEERIIQDHGG